jgi:hypothetical protein
MNKISAFLRWLDDNILLILATFLLAFIPLYPKIPLWSPIEQYIVRVRLEDFFILFTVLVWGVQVLRKKVRWYSIMFWLVLAYAIIGALSVLSAIFIVHSVPMQFLHVGKTVLHYFRYLEYFSLFFVLYSAIKTRKDVVRALTILTMTVVAITVYGYGQKFFYWPVYSTMNREFSKGIRLYLTEFARVQSTFGGHYDMAAYLVIMLPLLLALAYRASKKWISTALHVSFWLGTWLLILSASRTPFAAYFAGVMIVIFFTALFRKTWKDKATFFVSRSAITVALIGVLFFYFGADMAERLNQVVSSSPQLSSIADSLTNARRMVISDDALAHLPLSPKQLNAMLPKAPVPEKGIAVDTVAATTADIIATKSDLPPVPAQTPKPTKLPAGVYVDVPDQVTVIASDAAGNLVPKTVSKPRVYSECTLKKELSLCIRLETLWPRALEGFYTNPALGTGYATLTKESVEQFTEADSTDNNYLRTLGETGALGFISFYGIVAVVLFFAAKNFASKDSLKSAYSIGLFAGTVALLLNAVYIDVFASSKVALSYWALAGILFAFISLDKRSESAAALHTTEDSASEDKESILSMISASQGQMKSASKKTHASKNKKTTRKSQ